jgi:hypothetical protein
MPATRRLPGDTSTPAQSADAPPVDPETLARTLRAVAAELERDPALARRVASAVAANANANANANADDTSVGASGGRPDANTDAQSADARKSKRTPRAFTPRLVTGASPELGPGIPDPFALRERLGMGGLRAALQELRLGTLRAIVREHRLDPADKLTRLNDAAKLRETILAAVAAR